MPTPASARRPGSCRVLADVLRTDHAHLRALQPRSEAAQELKLLTEDCQRHIRQQTRLVNQLTATLKAYYPRPLEVAEVTSALAREFLPAYPTPEALTALTERQWQRWARGHRLTEARAGELWTILRRPQLPVPAHVVRAESLRPPAARATAGTDAAGHTIRLRGQPRSRRTCARHAAFSAWPHRLGRDGRDGQRDEVNTNRAGSGG
jgi:hypothetical protein